MKIQQNRWQSNPVEFFSSLAAAAAAYYEGLLSHLSVMRVKECNN